MSDDLFIPADVATVIRAAMTAVQAAEAADARKNVFLAMALPDADVVFMLAERMLEAGGTDLDSFVHGFIAGRASTLSPSAHEKILGQLSASAHAESVA